MTADVGDEIRVERDGSGVVVITLNRPERFNALPRTHWKPLKAVFDDVAASMTDRAVVVTGAGGNFCSGADLSARPKDSERLLRRGLQPVLDAALAIRNLPQPTIAAVSGWAAGAGMNLALLCDLVIADETAKFSQIFVDRGLTIDFGGTWLLPHSVGLHRAKEMALFARKMSGEQLREWGVVNRIVPAGQALHVARSWAADLAARAPHAVQITKEQLNYSLAQSFEESLMRESMAQDFVVRLDDTKEAMSAFLEKRTPEFRGR
ncbi:enoyl-CoA hydratase [Amycolatopsis sp. K13G38]|uniref:Enoyl-CoA hydratase n=1 Tax=Amycolatopsis acididurans TaxID=2724524 RepID=A0ABX1IZ26_9PSEU|nr:enoyl-CoA hydratase-related protein [Amycolatopsis acididurans]NKQ52406.1 enoyl-CoA hydratase [Amycolatopsis acididurans]